LGSKDFYDQLILAAEKVNNNLAAVRKHFAQ